MVESQKRADGEEVSRSSNDVPLEWKPKKPEYLIMICLSIISLVVALDATILVPALPIISKALNGSATITFWAGTSYLLTSAVFQPFLGALSDIFGRREILLLSLLLFTIGTVVCCTANDFTELLIGRSVQGIGGGGIIAMVLVIFTDIIPLRQRPKYNGYVQMAWALGTITGPLIGGAFSQHLSWRWIFYINFPFCAIGLLMVPLVVKLKKPKPSLRAMLLQVDWFGGFLFIGSTTSFLVGVTWGGTQYPWVSYNTLLPLCMGIIRGVASIFWEKWGAKFPFLRLSIFTTRSGFAAYTCATIQGLILYAELYYISFYLQAIKSLSPTMNGVALLPITCGLLPASVIVGVLMSKYGRFRPAVWAGWIVTVLATSLLCLLGTNTSIATYVVIFLCVGLGQGLLLSSLNFTVQAIASTQDVAYAAALYAFLRGVGLCLGVAIGGTIFQNFLSRYLAQAGLPTAIAGDAEGFIATLKSLQESKYKEDLLHAFSRAFVGLFAILSGISTLGGFVSLAVRKHGMDKPMDSEHVLQQKGTEASQSDKNTTETEG